MTLKRLGVALAVALAIWFFAFAIARAYDHERVVYCTPVVQGDELYAEDCYTR